MPPDDDQYYSEVDLDMEGYYQNYATRENMSIDNFTHHELTGNASYIYNDRLTLGDTLQKLANPNIDHLSNEVAGLIQEAGGTFGYINPHFNFNNVNTDFEEYAVYSCKIQIKLNTSNGIKGVEVEKGLSVWHMLLDNSVKCFFLNSLIGYYDSRATEIIININNGGTWLEAYRANLEKKQVLQLRLCLQ